MNRELDNWQIRSEEEMRIEYWYKLTEREDERALRRRLARRAVLEVIGFLFVTVLVALVCWLFLASTPSQFSAEAEACAEEIENASGK